MSTQQPTLKNHRLRVTIKNCDGLKPDLVCVEHETEGCPIREAFFWDAEYAMECYQGVGIMVGEYPIEITAISEDEGFIWQLAGIR